MASIDWIILTGTLAFIVFFGVWKTRNSKGSRGYLLGDNEAKWWTVGLSVMATQASAITFLSTPGQAYHDGMGFVQFYFGLPLAMVIICVTFIPLYHKLKVYTAYEFLESRFDVKTRSLAAILFLIQRGLAAGITIYAPAIILSTILGWNLNVLNFAIGIAVVIYTVTGGTKAVNVTQKQQMAIIFIGMVAAFWVILSYLPDQLSFNQVLSMAGNNDKMDILNFSLDPSDRYTIWAGITGGLFLQLSYFGTDQSQVQRYLSGKSVSESRKGLIMNGLLKIPMQFFILLVGVMVFMFYQFQKAPVFFNPAVDEIYTTAYADDYRAIEETYDEFYKEKSAFYTSLAEQPSTIDNAQTAATIQSFNSREKAIRTEAKEVISQALPYIETNDKDYVFITFILNHLPTGLVGLLLAVIFSAAMSSTASELNALGSTTAIDIYKRNFRPDISDDQLTKSSKWLTLLWGLIAIGFACFGTLFENLIQFVNIIGSIFYGTILGIFLVAFYIKYVKSTAIFIAALITEVIVICVFLFGDLSYLWLNVIGCMVTILLSILIQKLMPVHEDRL